MIVHKSFIFIAKKIGLWSIKKDKDICKVHPTSLDVSSETKHTIKTNPDETNIIEKRYTIKISEKELKNT